jgi:coenzyme F420-reducing hydrogenase beta subunit
VAIEAETRPSEAARLVETVVEGGYCIGCGACAVVEGSPLEMALDEYGRWQARLRTDATPAMHDARVLDVCPFSGEGPDEDELAHELFAGEAPSHDSRIGHHGGLYAGHVSAGEHRAAGSSGGFTTWLLGELLDRGLVDAVLHVRAQGPTDEDPLLFRYRASTTPAEVRAGAKSRYYPVEMSEVLGALRDGEHRRYALVGVPCFVKAVRRLARTDDRVAARVAFALAIVCGHQKSTRFADLIGLELGVPLGELRAIDFRHKLPARPANRYGVEVRGTDGEVTTRPMSDVLGGNWGHGFFKYMACDYCDDVVGETADVSIGDAWLPGYADDPAGANVVVVRHPVIERVIDDGRANGQLAFDALSAEDVFKSQRSGFRHRRDGLAYRLARDDARGTWRPRKRVDARADSLGPLSKDLFRTRVRLAELSHRAFRDVVRGGQPDSFRRRVRPLMRRHDAVARAISMPTKRGSARRLAALRRRLTRSR